MGKIVFTLVAFIWNTILAFTSITPWSQIHSFFAGMACLILIIYLVEER